MKITVTIKEACEMTGLGKTTLYDLMNDGKIESVNIGRRRLIRVESLRRLLEAA